MTKEEILEKSRQENLAGDEREKKMGNYASAISGSIGIIVCFIIAMINNFYEGSQAVNLATCLVIESIYASKSIIDAILLKKKRSYFLAITWSLAFCFHFTAFLELLR